MKRVISLPTRESIIARKKPAPEVVSPPEPVRDSEVLIEAALEYFASYIERSDPDVLTDEQGIVFDEFSKTKHQPFYSLNLTERQEVLKRIASTPGYIISVPFQENYNFLQVPKYVFDWDELGTLTYNHLGSFAVEISE